MFLGPGGKGGGRVRRVLLERLAGKVVGLQRVEAVKGEGGGGGVNVCDVRVMCVCVNCQRLW